MKKLLSILLVSLLVVLTARSAAADEPQSTSVRKVTVTGTCIINVVPDEMLWTMQIRVHDATLAKAKARHDASLNAALKYLKSLGDSLKDLQTGGIRFEKELYPGENAELRKNPFSCSTQFTFTLTDFDKYGPMADTLSKLDGSEVQSVEYASSKEAETRREALKRALIDAHDKANDLAVTAGGSIDLPWEIVEQEACNIRPEMMNNRMSGSMAYNGTPEAVAGQIKISAKVVATYDLKGKRVL